MILAATGRENVDDGLEWITEDRALRAGTDPRRLLRALIALDEPQKAEEAIRKLTRFLVASDLDTAEVLFDSAAIDDPSKFRRALETLARKSKDGGLLSVTSSAAFAAQREDPYVIEALCAVAGLTYSELGDRAEVDLPSGPRDHWLAPQMRAAFKVVDDVVCSRVTSKVPDTRPARPIELWPEFAQGQGAGWEAVEEMRRNGVPYEVLLAQRQAGGAWLAHRNRTTGKVAASIASQLCTELDSRRVSYRRSKAVGGDVQASTLHALSGAGKQVGLVVVDSHNKPCSAVIFSIARDSGTASKSASRLQTMARGKSLALFLMLAGPGWAARNETADLATVFEGRVFSERDSVALADELAMMVKSDE